MKCIAVVANLKVGDKIEQYVDTLWGTRRSIETITAIRFNEADNLVELECRVGQVLQHLLRTSPKATITRIAEEVAS